MKCTISILQCTVSVFCIFPQKNLYCLSRDVFLPASEAPLLPAALLLHRHRLRPLLHDGLRLLDVLLAGPQGGAGQGGAGRDDPAGDVHHPGQHPEQPAARGLHQGHRRLVRGLCLLRLRGTAGVRDGQLRLQVGFHQDVSNFTKNFIIFLCFIYEYQSVYFILLNVQKCKNIIFEDSHNKMFH